MGLLQEGGSSRTCPGGAVGWRLRSLRASCVSAQVSLPRSASEAVKVYLQRATEVVPVPVPRQTPAPPQPLAEPQPGPPPGVPGPECKIQVTTLTPSVAATRSEPLLCVPRVCWGFVGGAVVIPLRSGACAQELGWASAEGLRARAVEGPWRWACGHVLYQGDLLPSGCTLNVTGKQPLSFVSSQALPTSVVVFLFCFKEKQAVS